MLRTVSVLVAGVFWGVVVFAGLVWMTIHLPQQFRLDAYYLINGLTGGAVGLFVGFSKVSNAGLIAIICLLPPLFLQYGSRFSGPLTGHRLFLALLGTFLELSLAFAIAYSVSAARRRSSGANE